MVLPNLVLMRLKKQMMAWKRVFGRTILASFFLSRQGECKTMWDALLIIGIKVE
jgi:hypothetical protein